MKNAEQKIQIFGQRCSGTTFLEKLLLANFEEVKIVHYYGFKHVFNATLQKPIRSEDDIKIIIIVRNLYDWIRSVHREPHHCALLLGLSFDDFIKAPWKAYPSADWNNYDRKTRLQTVDDTKLIESFENVIACRNAKMKLFAQINKHYDSVCFVTYEALRDDTKATLENLKHQLQLSDPVDFQQVYTYKESGKNFKPKRYIKIWNASLQFINDRIDWSNEAYFGYKRLESVEGTLLNYHRVQFLAKQWYYENLAKK